jgi:hypothetical protein
VFISFYKKCSITYDGGPVYLCVVVTGWNPQQPYLGNDIRPSIIPQAVENPLQLALTYTQKVLYYFKV